MEKFKKSFGPVGWLVDPHNKWAIHFDFKSLPADQSDTDFTIDMWGVVPNGKPMTFKSRRKVSKQESHKAWNQLINSNWVEYDFANNKTA